MTKVNWDSRGFRKSSFSGDQGGGQDSGGNCVYLDGSLRTVADSKSGILLGLPAAGLVSLAKRS